MLDQIVENWVHWPFAAVTIIFIVLGYFLWKKFFTRERAYAKMNWLGHLFFYWGREGFILIPLVLGGCIGIFWQNPENESAGWPWLASPIYFAAAGALALVVLVLAKGWAKSKGLKLDLPGDDNGKSKPPAPPPVLPEPPKPA